MNCFNEEMLNRIDYDRLAKAIVKEWHRLFSLDKG